MCPIAKYCEIMKMVKFRTKSALFVSFLTKIFKNYCHISNQQLRICLIAKFCEETKMLKFGARNPLFENFCPKMLSLGIFPLELKKTIVIFEISALEFV